MMLTNEEFGENWQDYAVTITKQDGTVELIRLQDRYAINWGWQEQCDGFWFDQGGGQPGIIHTLRVQDGCLFSVNPENKEEVTRIGRLVKVEDS